MGKGKIISVLINYINNIFIQDHWYETSTDINNSDANLYNKIKQYNSTYGAHRGGLWQHESFVETGWMTQSILQYRRRREGYAGITHQSFTLRNERNNAIVRRECRASGPTEEFYSFLKDTVLHFLIKTHFTTTLNSVHSILEKGK